MSQSSLCDSDVATLSSYTAARTGIRTATRTDTRTDTRTASHNGTTRQTDALAEARALTGTSLPEDDTIEAYATCLSSDTFKYKACRAGRPQTPHLSELRKVLYSAPMPVGDTLLVDNSLYDP